MKYFGECESMRADLIFGREEVHIAATVVDFGKGMLCGVRDVLYFPVFGYCTAHISFKRGMYCKDNFG